MTQVHQQILYDYVGVEIRDGKIDQTLWSKASHVSSNDKQRTVAVYIEMRVAQIARDTRQVKMVSEHRSTSYGLNKLFLLVGWIPPIGSWYLLRKNTGWRRAGLATALSFVAILGMLVISIYFPNRGLFVISTGLALWYWAWYTLASHVNRWIAEGAEPLKSVLVSVDSADVKAYQSGIRKVVLK